MPPTPSPSVADQRTGRLGTVGSSLPPTPLEQIGTRRPHHHDRRQDACLLAWHALLATARNRQWRGRQHPSPCQSSSPSKGPNTASAIWSAISSMSNSPVLRARLSASE